MLAAEEYTQVAEHQQRQFQRVQVDLYGRFMLPDRTEHTCRITDMSPGNAGFETTAKANIDDKVIVYIDHIGRIVGTVTKCFPKGFAIEFDLTPQKRERVAARITWLANKHELNLPEDRRHERLVPRNQFNTLSLGDGREYSCRIIDMSLSGAAVEINVRPAIGTPVTLANMRGRVVRHFDDGIAIEFAHIQSRETLSTFLD